MDAEKTTNFESHDRRFGREFGTANTEGGAEGLITPMIDLVCEAALAGKPVHVCRQVGIVHPDKSPAFFRWLRRCMSGWNELTYVSHQCWAKMKTHTTNDPLALRRELCDYTP